MIQDLLSNIAQSPTAFHAAERAAELLQEKGFVKIFERDFWRIAKGGKYYVMRNGSSLIAFEVGENYYYNIVAAHTDSPALKLKDNAEMESCGCGKLNVEVYGGPILNTFMDRKLAVCGRAIYDTEKGVETRLVSSNYNVVIPNISIHQNREVNNGVKLNPQVDLLPVTGLTKTDIQKITGECLDYELFAVCAEKGFVWGENDEFISSPRLDDLEGVFAGINALTSSTANGINMLVLFDNEEIGSSTRQGAGSTFLKDITKRISYALGRNPEEYQQALANSFMISLDNAHAKHPNHPELSDPTNNTLLGGGVVIKHHAGFSYTTDGYSSALIKKLFREAGVKYQDFYNRSDARGGGTLGSISSGRLSIMSIDIGLAQFAMHSAVESAAVSDYDELIGGLKAFYNNFKL